MKKILVALTLTAGAALTSCNGVEKKGIGTEIDTISYELGMANSVDEDQIKQWLASGQVGSDTAYVREFLRGVREGLQGGSDKKKAAYIAGLSMGMQSASQLAQMDEFILGADSTSKEKFSREKFYAGFRDGVGGKYTALKIDGALITRDNVRYDVQPRISALAAKVAEKKYGENKRKSEAFIAAKAKEAGIQKLPGGTLYKVLVEGEGEPAHDGQIVNIVYEGRLADGTVFDASKMHPGPDGESVPMAVGSAVPGFNEALKAMPVGAKWIIYIPYDQAYGEQDKGSIPPFSALVFELTILSKEEAHAPANLQGTIREE